MFQRISRICLVVACIFVTMGLSCNSVPDRVHPPKYASGAGSAAMGQYDTNSDGKVSGDELDAAPSLKMSMDTLDTNGDGAVDAGEVDARVNSWLDSKVGRMGAQIILKRGSKYLEGATVELIPEQFLGTGLKPAKGVTGPYGDVLPDAPADPDRPEINAGVAPGFYLIRITKDGENLPAKFNTSTIYGVEVANDSKYANEPLEIDLNK